MRKQERGSATAEGRCNSLVGDEAEVLGGRDAELDLTPDMARLLNAMRIPGVFAVLGAYAWLRDSEVAAAQLFAIAAILSVTLILFTTGPRRPVALSEFPGVPAGLEVPADLVPKPGTPEPNKTLGVNYKFQHGLFFRGLVLGKDGRWSTSKLQVLLWTYALLFALASIFLADLLGVEEGVRSLEDQESEDWDIYLVLLGGPFAALVLAQGIISTKAAEGKIAKTATAPTTGVVQGLTEVISNDAGETDIVDLQYFLFNVLALLVFLISFVPDLAGGLPELPSFLAVLTGASAATYVGKKAAEREQPSITAVLPAKARPGGKLEIWGRSLVLGELSAKDREPLISIGSTAIEDVSIVDDTLSGLDHLRCTLPEETAVGADTLRIVTRAGVSAESALQVVSAKSP